MSRLLCPVCAHEAFYVGLVSVECYNPACKYKGTTLMGFTDTPAPLLPPSGAIYLENYAVSKPTYVGSMPPREEIPIRPETHQRYATGDTFVFPEHPQQQKVHRI